MNTLRKITSMFVAVMLVVICFAGCQKSDAETFVGSWTATKDMTDSFVESMGDMGDYKVDKNLKLKVDFKFSYEKEGKYELTVDKDKFKTDVLSFVKSMFNDYIPQMAKDNGMEVDDLLKLLGVKSIDELVDTQVPVDELSSSIEKFEVSGDYLVEDGKLYMSSDSKTIEDAKKDSEYTAYEIKDENTISFTSAFENDEKSENEIFPLTLKRDK